MHRTVLLALGVLLTISASLTGLVLVPNWQFQELKPVQARDGSRQYPEPLYGVAKHGRDVYIDQGCLYCHSQQVRMKGYGADIRRNWGTRRTVARDYLFDSPVMLGTMRTGPDLANIGARQPSESWHLLHLYNPQITSPGSVMPPYSYLFKTVKRGQEPTENAIKLPGQWGEGDVTHIVPTARAEELVAYLKTLNKSFPLPEAN